MAWIKCVTSTFYHLNPVMIVIALMEWAQWRHLYSGPTLDLGYTLELLHLLLLEIRIDEWSCPNSLSMSIQDFSLWSINVGGELVDKYPKCTSPLPYISEICSTVSQRSLVVLSPSSHTGDPFSNSPVIGFSSLVSLPYWVSWHHISNKSSTPKSLSQDSFGGKRLKIVGILER